MLVAILIELLVAGLAGWLAGKIMHYNKSVFWNIVLGLIGGVVGAAILSVFGLHAGGFIGSIVVAIIGACVLVWLARLITK